jgi:hypothetical protein
VTAGATRRSSSPVTRCSASPTGRLVGEEVSVVADLERLLGARR